MLRLRSWENPQYWTPEKLQRKLDEEMELYSVAFSQGHYRDAQNHLQKVQRYRQVLRERSGDISSALRA